MTYFVLATSRSLRDGAVVEGFPESPIADWRYHEGETLVSAFPAEAAIRFSSNYPDNRTLYDFVNNPLGVLIVSSKVRRILDGMGAQDIEYLPVGVLDHKGGMVAPDYFILNPLKKLPAVDMERSEYRMNRIQKDQIHRIKNLVLAQDGIPEGTPLFRLEAMRRTVLVSEAVREAMEGEGVTVYQCIPAEGWNGLVL